jgi:hypothetical protein
MLFGGTVAVYCENHTKHIDTLCVSRRSYSISPPLHCLYIYLRVFMVFLITLSPFHTAGLWREVHALKLSLLLRSTIPVIYLKRLRKPTRNFEQHSRSTDWAGLLPRLLLLVKRLLQSLVTGPRSTDCSRRWTFIENLIFLAFESLSDAFREVRHSELRQTCR